MTLAALLELQLTDSAIDQIRLRMPRLPEVIAAQAAANEVSAWEARTQQLRGQIEQFESAITTAEAASAVISKQRSRLEQQLKTVIAPREAEALMHEIALLNGKRSALDDDELVALEAMSSAESELAEHALRESLLRSAAAAASETASAAVAASEADLASKTVARDEMRSGLDPSMVRRYDEMRGQHNGIAVAKLNGLRCEGCHLDLSRGEVDDIKRLPDAELPECPNCGRLLVR